MYSCEGKAVLIVDDDPEILQAIKIAFEDAGATIDTAADGNAAIDLATKRSPDLVVLDAMLPKRSGFWCSKSSKAPAKKRQTLYHDHWQLLNPA